MRPNRLMEFVIDTLGKATEVRQAEAWQDDSRPAGVHVTFATGSEMWLAVTGGGLPGEDYGKPEVPVTDAPPTEVPVPDLLKGGKVTPITAENYLTAVLTNSGSSEIRRVYAYSAQDTPVTHPGVGIEFHSGARSFIPFVHTRDSQGTKSQQAFRPLSAF